jgi:hypothetical protein
MKNEMFYGLFEDAPRIEFDPRWNNGTGYYDHAARGRYAPKLAVGQMVSAVSPMPNNRKIVIVGLGEDKGNFVFFERYTDGAHDVIVSNGETSGCPELVKDAMSSRVSDTGLREVWVWVSDQALAATNTVCYM